MEATLLQNLHYSKNFPLVSMTPAEAIIIFYQSYILYWLLDKDFPAIVVANCKTIKLAQYIPMAGSPPF